MVIKKLLSNLVYRYLGQIVHGLLISERLSNMYHTYRVSSKFSSNIVVYSSQKEKKDKQHSSNPSKVYEKKKNEMNTVSFNKYFVH